MPAVKTSFFVDQNDTNDLFTEHGAEVVTEPDATTLPIEVDLTKYEVVFFHSDALHGDFDEPEEAYDRVKLVKKIPE